jgi:hypothetical protein
MQSCAACVAHPGTGITPLGIDRAVCAQATRSGWRRPRPARGGAQLCSTTGCADGQGCALPPSDPVWRPLQRWPAACARLAVARNTQCACVCHLARYHRPTHYDLSDYSAAGRGRRAADELPRQQRGLHRRHPPRAAVPVRPVRSLPALTRGLRLPLLCQQAPYVIAGRHRPVTCGNCRVRSLARAGHACVLSLENRCGRVQVPRRATVCGWLQHVSGPECTRLLYIRCSS